MKKMLAFFLCVCMSASLLARDCTGLVPKNNLWISKDEKSAAMTEEQFLAIVSKVEKQYAEVVKEKGATLIMDNDWNDGTVNAYANQEGSEWHVHMFGGLARHPLTTSDGFALVVCHEIGHHLGGAPTYSGAGNEWAAVEGQADYWGTTKCLKKVLEQEDNIGIVSKMVIDPTAKAKCEMIYKSAAEIALCERVSMAGLSLAQLLGDLGGNSHVDFATPDKRVVKKTFEAHPQAQCRLDTYFQGSLCDKAWSLETDMNDPKMGVCIQSEGYKIGLRPLCWYKPAKGE